jgi:hypothetical protein
MRLFLEYPMICQHCQKATATRPKQLCRRCYYETPNVRGLYPSRSKHGRRGLADCYGIRPQASFPTRAIPGSAEKLAILAERAKLKLSLFHPNDTTEDNPGVEVALAD